MSPGADFQEAFLWLYSGAINLLLGVTLAVGITLAIVRSFVHFLAIRHEQLPEIKDE